MSQDSKPTIIKGPLPGQAVEEFRLRNGGKLPGASVVVSLDMVDDALNAAVDATLSARHSIRNKEERRMKAIWKFLLSRAGDQEIELPRGAELLTVQVQRGVICLWAVVDPNTTERDLRTFYIVGTGHPMPENPMVEYVGTIQELEGALVWHVFEGA